MFPKVLLKLTLTKCLVGGALADTLLTYVSCGSAETEINKMSDRAFLADILLTYVSCGSAETEINKTGPRNCDLAICMVWLTWFFLIIAIVILIITIIIVIISIAMRCSNRALR